MSFGRTLQRIRRDKRMTRRALADAIEMDYAYLSRLENDRFDHKPSRETVEKIANALECADEERSELLAEAGRIDAEMEQIARVTNERPGLRQLFRSAVGLPDDKLQELIEVAQRSAKNSKRRKQGEK